MVPLVFRLDASTETNLDIIRPCLAAGGNFLLFCFLSSFIMVKFVFPPTMGGRFIPGVHLSEVKKTEFTVV